ncbi:CHAD domain-containing protein [Ktedonobacter racemifer]|uniref:CHAD domain-containing protein n=1 Tax=Ktedonobacter racemifer TaxID=363277 RepID=UPI0002D9941A|nr:CHAD domain-containing protein [Ktedonobacter racemifer]
MAKARAIHGLQPHATTGENARKIIETRLDELYQWEKYVGEPYRSSELHDMRIAAKRLRYTLELFADALPPACAALVKDVEQIQGELGELHDNDVMVALLRLCLGSVGGGNTYQAALTQVPTLAKKKSQGKTVIEPALVAHMADPKVAPSAEERLGLEALLRAYEKQREQSYIAFREHWQQLQERDFRRELLYSI